jgi:hypothetical protein
MEDKLCIENKKYTSNSIDQNFKYVWILIVNAVQDFNTAAAKHKIGTKMCTFKLYLCPLNIFKRLTLAENNIAWVYLRIFYAVLM